MHQNSRRFASGFTLIELLIVVAIIAILAAIAVPNFLEAQTRAKVSRAKADMRSVATAIESYRVDNNNYPLAAQLSDLAIPVIKGTEEVIEAIVPYSITTPIAYITALPRDPFPPKDEGLGNETKDHSFHYLDRKSADVRGEPTVIEDYHEKLYGTQNSSVAWWMFTLGPDLQHDENLDGTEPEYEAAAYDPTNGTISNGDIFMFQGKGLSN
jgi:type II secretion system protein G